MENLVSEHTFQSAYLFLAFFGGSLPLLGEPAGRSDSGHHEPHRHVHWVTAGHSGRAVLDPAAPPNGSAATARATAAAAPAARARATTATTATAARVWPTATASGASSVNAAATSRWLRRKQQWK